MRHFSDDAIGQNWADLSSKDWVSQENLKPIRSIWSFMQTSESTSKDRLNKTDALGALLEYCWAFHKLTKCV